MNTPYIGFNNDQLKDAPNVNEGDLIECIKCGGVHPVEFATENGKKTNMLGAYRCGDKEYLACIAGKLVSGIKPACSGKI